MLTRVLFVVVEQLLAGRVLNNTDKCAARTDDDSNNIRSAILVSRIDPIGSDPRASRLVVVFCLAAQSRPLAG